MAKIAFTVRTMARDQVGSALIAEEGRDLGRGLSDDVTTGSAGTAIRFAFGLAPNLLERDDAGAAVAAARLYPDAIDEQGCLSRR